MNNQTKRTRQDIIEILKHHQKDLQVRFKVRFKVKKIGVFGSCVRGEQKKESDIDILVEFEKGHKTFNNYMDLKFFLEEIFGVKVDLVIKDAVRRELREYILSEVVYV